VKNLPTLQKDVIVLPVPIACVLSTLCFQLQLSEMTDMPYIALRTLP
jgi:hypothetical protein